jgi:selenocysteine lyase/cysteine desulfurase
VSTICWTTGALTDLDAIVAETAGRGIFLVVDAIQTFGVVPFDVKKTPASFVAAGGLKWLCATPGSGFLWVNPLVAARARPARFGMWSGQPSTHRGWQDWLMSGVASLEDEILFQAQGRSFETGGTPNYAAGVGLLTMGRLLERTGTHVILDRVRLLADEVVRGLDALGLEVVTPRETSQRANMIVFRAPKGREHAIELAARLAERRVAVNVRWMKGHGGVRVSIHAMNTREDVERLFAALRSLV